MISLTWGQVGRISSDREVVVRIMEEQVAHFCVLQPCVLSLEQYFPDLLGELGILRAQASRRLTTGFHVQVQDGGLLKNPVAWKIFRLPLH